MKQTVLLIMPVLALLYKKQTRLLKIIQMGFAQK
jgi:hypothetical protein